MFVNMAQGIYNGYLADVAAVDAFFAGNAAARLAANAAGVALPAALPANPPLANVVAYTQAIVAAHNAIAGTAAAVGMPPIRPQLTPVQAMDQVLTQYTTEQLAYYIDRLWEQNRTPARNVVPGGVAVQQQNMSFDIRGPAPLGNVVLPPHIGYWRHIVYAYLLECTNVLQVFQRVVQEWVQGEHLPFATQPTHMWLRATEQLFFTNPQPPSILSLTSDIRPDRTAIRRNAYYRLLGFDLPVGAADGRPSAFIKADVANREFVSAWEQLLYETWRAYTNRTNYVGPNSTDPTGIAELVRQIREMLTARRNGGALAREEAQAVAQLSWFHLTVLDNTQVVVNLTAQSTSSALRLKKIADRVGVPIHSRTDSFFQIAQPMANVLEAIEAGTVDANPNDVDMLYLGNGILAQSMRVITNHWSLVTGRAIKGVDVRAIPPSPISSGANGGATRASTSGRIPVSILAGM
jgi:hypothetical protein